MQCLTIGRLTFITYKVFLNNTIWTASIFHIKVSIITLSLENQTISTNLLTNSIMIIVEIASHTVTVIVFELLILCWRTEETFYISIYSLSINTTNLIRKKKIITYSCDTVHIALTGEFICWNEVIINTLSACNYIEEISYTWLTILYGTYFTLLWNLTEIKRACTFVTINCKAFIKGKRIWIMNVTLKSLSHWMWVNIIM